MKTDTATGRTYTIDGNEYVSVTTVLNCASKPFLYAWYGKVGNAEAKRISNESKDIGSRSHTEFENIIRYGVKWQTNFLLEPELEFPVNNFKRFLSNLDSYKDVFGERVVYSDKYGYAGTLDRLAFIDGKLTLVDWKTSNSMNDEYIIQTMAYYVALTEMAERGTINLPGKIERLAVVRLDKKNEYDHSKDFISVKPNKQAFKAFLGLLQYYKNKDFNKKEKK